MKKLSLYIFLGLMWCNVGFAEQIIIECLGTHSYEGGEKKWNKWKRTIQVDFVESGIRDYGLEGFTGDFNNIIITDDYFYDYGLIVFLVPEFLVQVSKIDRLLGDMSVTTTFINEEIYKEIKIKLDEVNSKIKNYEKQLSHKYEVYNPSKLGNNQQEIEKYNIVKPYAEGVKGKRGITQETTRNEFECKKATKAF